MRIPGSTVRSGRTRYSSTYRSTRVGIDAGPAPTAFARAETLAAEAYGARRAWFLSNGATQGNHALCLALAPPGSRIVMQRNSHASVLDGLILSGGLPTFVTPAYDDELGVAHGVTPESLTAALARCPDARAAFIVSPTYYGMAADVEACAEVAHAAGVPLIVDCSWGAHFGFHAKLPENPIVLGADAMLASTHKIVGSLTQTAMLLVSDSGRVDPDDARARRPARSVHESERAAARVPRRCTPAAVRAWGGADRPHDRGMGPYARGDRRDPWLRRGRRAPRRTSGIVG